MANTEKKSQIIFMNGKEIALKKLFNHDGGAFGYLAVGYSSQNGFVDENDFKELTEVSTYERIPLYLYESDPVDKDEDTGKVLVKFMATLKSSNIQESQNINQIAVVDSKNIGAETKYYSATTFPTFTKTSQSSITFVIGFRL